MRKTIFLLILPPVACLSLLTTSCTTKTEVVALQPVTRSAPTVRRTVSVASSSSSSTRVRSKGNPRPSPWATDVVNAYDDEKNE